MNNKVIGTIFLSIYFTGCFASGQPSAIIPKSQIIQYFEPYKAALSEQDKQSFDQLFKRVLYASPCGGRCDIVLSPEPTMNIDARKFFTSGAYIFKVSHVLAVKEALDSQKEVTIRIPERAVPATAVGIAFNRALQDLRYKNESYKELMMSLGLHDRY